MLALPLFLYGGFFFGSSDGVGVGGSFFAWNEHRVPNTTNVHHRIDKLQREINASLRRVATIARRFRNGEQIDSKCLSESRKGLLMLVGQVRDAGKKLAQLEDSFNVTDDGNSRMGDGLKTRRVRLRSSSQFLSAKFYRYKQDPIIDNLTYYLPRGLHNDTSLSIVEIDAIANKIKAEKGYDVAYANSYNTIHTNGTYFQYKHKYADPCMLHYVSLKYDAACGDSRLDAKFVRQILVTSVQRSGTHFTWEMLNRLGVHVHHEGVGPDGAIGWLYAVNAVTGGGTSSKAAKTVGNFAGKGYVINNPTRLTRQRFRYVFHQVRHPLRVISTLVTRCSNWDKYWTWISTIKGCELITKETTPLKRSMLLYILWNKQIERYADLRFRTETTSLRDICTWSNFNASMCNTPNSELVTIVEPAGYEQEKITTAAGKAEEVSLVDLQGQQEGIGEEQVEEATSLSNRRRLLSLRGKGQAVKATLYSSLPRHRRSKEEEESGGEAEEKVEQEEQEEQEEERQQQEELLPVPDAKDAITIDPYLHITWSDLEVESMELANELKIMCVEYGYPLDPNQAPQSFQSHQFTA